MTRAHYPLLTILLFASLNVFSQNTWLVRANFGGGARTGATGFSIGTKAYVGTGYVNHMSEFHTQLQRMLDINFMPENQQVALNETPVVTKGQETHPLVEGLAGTGLARLVGFRDCAGEREKAVVRRFQALRQDAHEGACERCLQAFR